MNLNTIKAEYRKTEYSSSEHLVITVDGITLDHIIHEFYPNQNYLGLIPTLLECLDNEQEREIVWNKIDEVKARIPILMCPDDCDLWCIIIIADSEIIDDKVHWKRIGIDKTNKDGFSPDKIGTTVDWFDKLNPMIFSLDEYQKCINTFKNALE